MISQEEQYDLVFDAVFQAVPQANNEQLHAFCVKKFESSGSRGCIYLSYDNMQQMLHTDEHRMTWKPISDVRELIGNGSDNTSDHPEKRVVVSPQLMHDLKSYEPEQSYILLVSCPMEVKKKKDDNKPTPSTTLTPSAASTPTSTTSSSSTATSSSSTSPTSSSSPSPSPSILLFKHKVIDGKLGVQVTPPQIREQVLQIPICFNCRQPKDKLYRCSACTGVLYCSKECAKAHWPEHRPTCLELRKLKQQEQKS